MIEEADQAAIRRDTLPRLGRAAVLMGGEAVAALGVGLAAQLACLAAALSYGIAPMATAAGQVTAWSLMLLPLMLVVDRPWTLPAPSGEAILELVGLAGLSTALAFILYFRILASAGATSLLLVTFLIPVSAILLGVLVLGETILPKHLLGMTFISLGFAAIDRRPWRMLSRAARPLRA